MQVSVETTNGLERRMTVEIPRERIDLEVKNRLKSLSGKVKMSGFRPGKVPLKVVEKQYGGQVHREVVGDLMQSSFYEAVTQEKLRPAGMPHIVPRELADGDKEFGFIATFEVYPEFTVTDLNKMAIDKPVTVINDADVDKVIEVIRKQRVEWKPVDRAAKDGDRVTLDFDGYIDGETFQGGSGKQMAVELGAKRMIPGFEDQLGGIKANDERELSLSFPETYHAKELAGKPVTFKVKATLVEEPALPELNDDFAKAMGVADGGIEAFRQQVRENMAREADQSLKGKVKDNVLEALLKHVTVDVPKSLIDNEVNSLIKQQKEQQGAQELNVNAQAMEEQARRRVALGLILSEIVAQNGIKVEPAKVREIIESVASGYEKSEEVVKYYYSDRSRLAEVENFALEQEVVDWVLSQAKVKDIDTPFDTIMNRG